MIRLKEECIILELQSTSKEELLNELAVTAQRECPAIQSTVISRMLTEREQLGSTGVGDGVAIPHAKIPGLRDLVLCFGKSSRGIGFDAKDKRPVHLFILILSPMDLAEEYLQTLGWVSRLLKDEVIRNQFLLATNTAVIQQLFNQP